MIIFCGILIISKCGDKSDGVDGVATCIQCAREVNCDCAINPRMDPTNMTCILSFIANLGNMLHI